METENIPSKANEIPNSNSESLSKTGNKRRAAGKEKSKPKKKSKNSSGTGFSVGETVEAVWSGDGTFYPGKVVKVDIKNGTCDIRFDDGDSENGVLVSNIKKVKMKKPKAKAKKEKTSGKVKPKEEKVKLKEEEGGDPEETEDEQYSSEEEAEKGKDEDEAETKDKDKAKKSKKKDKTAKKTDGKTKKKATKKKEKIAKENNVTDTNGVKMNVPEDKYVVKHSSHIVKCKRLLLDKAIAQGSTEGWSEARIRAFQTRESNPNSYYYRFNDPGEDQGKGKWSEEEKQRYLARLKEVGPDAGWGIFSMTIPGRVGYQCSNFYRQLIEQGEVKDENYTIDEKGKAHFLKSLDKKKKNGGKRTISTHVLGIKIGKRTGKFGKCGEPTFAQLRAAGSMFKPGDFALLKNGDVAEIREIFEKTDPENVNVPRPNILSRRFISEKELKNMEGGENAIECYFSKLKKKTIPEHELVETSQNNAIVDARQIEKFCAVKFVANVPKKAAEPEAIPTFFVRLYFDINEKALLRRVSAAGQLISKSAITKKVGDIRRERKMKEWEEQEKLRIEKEKQYLKDNPVEESESEDEAMPEVVSEYEKQRAARVKDNLAMMQDLGLSLS